MIVIRRQEEGKLGRKEEILSRTHGANGGWKITVGPFTLAWKTCDVRKIVTLRWKLLSNHAKIPWKLRQKNSKPSGIFLKLCKVSHDISRASVNANRRKIMIFHHVTITTAGLVATRAL